MCSITCRGQQPEELDEVGRQVCRESSAHVLYYLQKPANHAARPGSLISRRRPLKSSKPALGCSWAQQVERQARSIQSKFALTIKALGLVLTGPSSSKVAEPDWRRRPSSNSLACS